MDETNPNLYNSCMFRSPTPDRIKNFNLYGDARNLPDVVHCESIAARSVLHNWEFTPHRHTRLHQVLVIDQGGGRAELDGHVHALSRASLVNVPVGCVHAFSFREQTQGWVVTLGQEILDESLKQAEGVMQVLSTPSVAQVTRQIRDLVDDLVKEHASLSFARAHILRAMSGLLVGQVARVISRGGKLSETAPGPDLKRRFEALLDDQFYKQHSVAAYADMLAVTPGHLSRVMRQSTGLPASLVIEERIVREARRHLAYTSLSIAEIAYALGFIDPAYFTRVFTRSTGVSPRGFRQQMEPEGVSTEKAVELGG